ncbi:MAG TPA: DUF5362 family protein [Flavisolibacter sp.]|nr:DUF5362 family protein [Flavisolibacter sp.]
MEHNQTASLFSLSIDPVTKAHLSETARWARFLSIIGFIFLGIMILAGVSLSLFVGRPLDTYGGSSVFDAFSVGMAFFYLILAVLWFFPLLFLFRFATRMKTALNSNDQNALNIALQNLKICFRYVGVITIIVLALYALAIVFAIVGATAFS